MTAKREIKSGDWVRFLRGGRLVIDQVVYTAKPEPWEIEKAYVTIHHGVVTAKDVLEVRHDPA